MPLTGSFVVYLVVQREGCTLTSKQKEKKKKKKSASSHLRTRPAAGPRIPCAEERWKNPAAARQLCFGSRFPNGPPGQKKASQNTAGHGRVPVGKPPFCWTLGVAEQARRGCWSNSQRDRQQSAAAPTLPCR